MMIGGEEFIIDDIIYGMTIYLHKFIPWRNIIRGDDTFTLYGLDLHLNRKGYGEKTSIHPWPQTDIEP